MRMMPTRRQVNYYGNTSSNREPTEYDKKIDKYAMTFFLTMPLWIFPLCSAVINAVYTVPVLLMIFIAYKIINPKKKEK